MDASPTLPDDVSNPETEQAIDDLQTHADNLASETDLSTRQAMVLLLSNRGLSTNTIANALDLSSPSTVSEHRNAADDHVERSERLASLSALAPLADGQHLLYRVAASVGWTPANYGGGSDGEDVVTLTIYKNTYDEQVIYQREGLVLENNGAMERHSQARRFSLGDAEGRDENESRLIEDVLWTPEFDHLAEVVAVAKVIDDSGLSGGGHCVTRAGRHYYGKDYDTAAIEDVLICGLVSPLTAANVLVESEHDLAAIEKYGDFGGS
jgi:DNA-binding CsgD family transcriptional regulator